MRRDGWRAPRKGRLTCRTCGSKVGHAEAVSVNERKKTCTCLACRERMAAAKDTGWRILQAPHGPRLHREVGSGVQLDVEHQPAGWAGAVCRDKNLVFVVLGLPTAAEAARAVEIQADVTAAPLPESEAPNGR